MMWVGKTRFLTEMHARDRVIEALKAQNALLETEVDRLRLEVDRSHDDVRQLTMYMSGRIPPRGGTVDLNRDPFEEDRRQVDVFLSPSEDEMGFAGTQAREALATTADPQELTHGSGEDSL